MTKTEAAIYLGGTFLAIDPSSCSSGSGLGWAVFKEGRVVRSGRLTLPAQLIYCRLQYINNYLQTLGRAENAQAIAVEMLRSRAHTYLRWSAALAIVCVTGPVIEIAPSAWRAYAKKAHLAAKSKGEATDEADAVEIGYAALRTATRVMGSTDRPGASNTRAKRPDRVRGRTSGPNRRARRKDSRT